MVYYARVVFETKASAAERHEDFDEARRWIEQERQSKPELFLFGQIIEATPARPVVASCNANGWNPV
jgi:RimJ/RimL family protein N-acetyltransferase